MNYWVFVSNPRRFPIDKFVRERLSLNGNTDVWTIAKHQTTASFATGDLGLVRVGTDARTKDQLTEDGAAKLQPGIYGVCQVEDIQPSKSLIQRDQDLWRHESSPTAPANPSPDRPQILIRYLWWSFDTPALIADLKLDLPDFNRRVLNGAQTSCFPIRKDEFEAVLSRLPPSAAVVVRNHPRFS